MPQISTFIFDVDGVLTNGIVHITSNGELLRNMNIKDGYAIKTALKLGYKICIISGGTNKGVKSRLQELGVTDIYLGTYNKIEQFEDFLNGYNIKPENVLYMGDDIPDYEVMQLAALPCCPKDAVAEIQAISKYILDISS